jgi:hypothetical protein
MYIRRQRGICKTIYTILTNDRSINEKNFISLKLHTSDHVSLTESDKIAIKIHKIRCIQVVSLYPYHHYLELHTTGTTWGLHHRPVPYSVGVSYPPCAVRDVNTLLNYQVRIITVFTVFRLLTDFVFLYTYEFWLSLCKIARSSVILLLPLLSVNTPCISKLYSYNCEMYTPHAGEAGILLHIFGKFILKLKSSRLS